MALDESALSLDNCDQEPIHIPGSIQPQGALLAFDLQGCLTHFSQNASAVLGRDFAFGDRFDGGLFNSKEGPQIAGAISLQLSSLQASRSLQAVVHGTPFDIVVSRSSTHVVCEFEFRDMRSDIATFAELAFRSLNSLKQSLTVQELLDEAVVAIRGVTGFDRVMAYRFAHDDSGSIVAESKVDELEPYLGRRYPASDIPVQARRLYILNTIRHIADVSYRPVPIVAAPSEKQPLDLSHCVLRSVSPIHVEYLTNMGVHGSMSASIVTGGHLWGMIACHHMSAMHVAYPVRMAVDVMAQVIAAAVQSIIARRREGAAARAANIRAEVSRAIAVGESMVEIVRRNKELLKQTLTCDGVFLALDREAKANDGIDHQWSTDVAAWLCRQQGNLVHVHRQDGLPPWPNHVPESARFCGLLAVRFDGARHGWIVGLRREQILTIRWGGKPVKHISHGPNGPRLTPRGSFEEWKETVRGTSSPWSSLQLEIASQFMDAVGRAYSDKTVEADVMRSQLWAMLGHDLRNPLQSINMANIGIERGLDADRLNVVIRNSTNRMNRLLSDVLDVSRLQHGAMLTILNEKLDLSKLLRQLIDESAVAQADCAITASLPDSLPMTGDGGRLAQLFSNLFSNARHHGDGHLALAAFATGNHVIATVTNKSAPIPEEIVPTLFDPFKRASMKSLNNRTGMGLGLYIAAEVARGHRGSLTYVPGDGVVTFVVCLAVEPSDAA